MQNNTETNDYMLYFGEKMREAMKKVLTSPKKDGLYMPSCLSHVGESLTSDIIPM